MSLNDPQNIVRLLGMSGFSVRAELLRVEKQFGVEVLRKREVTAEDHQYYPQFEGEIRTEAGWMAQHYEVFYCLERSIRQLVEQILVEAKGPGWWEECVTQPIKDEAKKNRENEINQAVTARSDKLIDYITFGQLGDIIRANWDHFVDLFNSQKAMTRVLALLNTLRGPIAHCSPLPPDEVDRLRLAVRDWFRLME